jgi:hypothetical protein
MALVYCAAFVVAETIKQVLTFASLEDGRYVVDPGFVIVCSEFVKLIVSALLCASCERGALRLGHFSWMFAVPAVLFVINGNLYLLALQYAAPPLWMVLVQARVLFLALGYRLLFSRVLGRTRIAALALLVVGVTCSQLRPGFAGMSINTGAVVLAVAVSISSVACSLFIERLLKTHPCPFYLQQTQMYAYGLVAAVLVWLAGPQPHVGDDDPLTAPSLASSPPYGELGLLGSMGQVVSTACTQFVQLPLSKQLLTGAVVVTTGGGGLFAAGIVRHLDNIAKTFSTAIATIAIGAATAWLFPDSFALGLPFLLGTAAILVATLAYSTNSFRLVLQSPHQASLLCCSPPAYSLLPLLPLAHKEAHHTQPSLTAIDAKAGSEKRPPPPQPQPSPRGRTRHARTASHWVMLTEAPDTTTATITTTTTAAVAHESESGQASPPALTSHDSGCEGDEHRADLAV